MGDVDAGGKHDGGEIRGLEAPMFRLGEGGVSQAATLARGKQVTKLRGGVRARERGGGGLVVAEARSRLTTQKLKLEEPRITKIFQS